MFEFAGVVMFSSRGTGFFNRSKLFLHWISASSVRPRTLLVTQMPLQTSVEELVEEVVYIGLDVVVEELRNPL